MSPDCTTVTTAHYCYCRNYGYRQDVQLSQAGFVVALGKNREHIDDAIATRESNSDGKVMSYRASTFAPSAKLIILSRLDLLRFERTSRSKFWLRSTISTSGGDADTAS